MKYALLTVFTTLLCMVGVGAVDKGTLNLEAAQYCDMVHIHQQTGGEFGWPDYQHVYAEQCTPEGKLRKPL